MATEYPISKFFFKVDFGGVEFNCTEVSGLDFENEPIEYRGGADSEFHKRKQAGMFKYADVTIKRGTFADKTKEFYTQWAKTVYLQEGGQQYRGDLTISLLGEGSNNIIMSWLASGAYIKKIQSTDLKADANEIAIETAVFSVNKLTIL